MKVVESEGIVVDNPKTFLPKIQRKFVEDTEFTEEFLDEKYARVAPLTPKCQAFYDDFLLHFDKRTSPIPFSEIAEWAENKGHTYHAAVQWMRMIWKKGLVRRWYKGLWQNAVQGNVTGLKWGVHYLPVGEQNDVS